MKSGVGQVLVKPIDLFQFLDIVGIHLAPPPAAVGREGEGRRLLVVDDDPRHRKLAEVCFSNAGFDVVVAADGASALQIARREHPAAILSDVLMPKMDGFAFCLAVRRDPELRATPVILTSSVDVEPADRTLAARVGASVLLSKTDGMPAMVTAIVDVLRAAPAPAPGLEPIETGAEEHAHRALLQLERRARRTDQLLRRSSLQQTQLAVLAGVAEALTKNRAVDGALGDVLAACLDMAGISKGALYIEDDGRLALKHQIGFLEPEVPRLGDLFGRRDAFSDVTARGNVVVVPSTLVPTELGDSLLVDAGVASMLLVPISWADTTYGLMILASTTADITGADARAFAQVLGTQMGLAIGLAQSFTGLAASEKRYRTLTENANDAISILTLDGMICEVNRRVTDLLGYSAHQLVGHHVREFAAPGQEQMKRDDYSRSMALGGQPPPIGIRRSDGTIMLVEVSLSPVQVGAEQLVLAIGRDVTEELHARALLMTADRMSSIGTLAAGVAHEINNPLAAVMGNLEVAIDEVAHFGARPDETPNFTDLREMLRDAYDATNRVREIVKDLRIFSRASEEGRHCLVNPERVLDSTLRMAATEIRHRAGLVKEYGKVPCVLANESRLGQVFLNLIVNAAQAIPEGSADINKIVVTTSTDASGRVVVEIRDTGPGMTPEILQNLFTPFFTTKPPGVGTGLGLTICKRIVTELGGEIMAASEVGHGTSFKVFLPAAHGAATDTSGARPIVTRAIRRGRVLLVDDDEALGRAVARALGAEHDVTVLSSARAALDHIAAGERFDVILCDMMMPVVTGMDFYKALRERVTDQADRIIFLTGGAFTVSAREFLDRVPNACIEKPFAAHSLRATVNERVR